MKTKRLMRTWYKTDAAAPVLDVHAPDREAEAERYAAAVEEWRDPANVGTFSDPFPSPDNIGAGQIVAVDWSKRGEVEVTWLIASP